jgi:hypothetical protein
MNNDLIISIQTLQTTEHGSLKSLTPNNDGIYEGVPVAVYGKMSENMAEYDPASYVAGMTNQNSIFYKRLTRGGLYGENGHPDYSRLTKDEAIRRTIRIEPERHSHYFTKFTTKWTRNGNHLMVYADIHPWGKYGEFLSASFADKNINTCFSLRSLSQKLKSASGNRRELLALVTYDWVDTGGFAEASKRGVEAIVSNEELHCSVVNEDILKCSMHDLAMANKTLSMIGEEAIVITDQEVLDSFESEYVRVHKKDSVIGVYDKSSQMINNGAINVSPFHTLF